MFCVDATEHAANLVRAGHTRRSAGLADPVVCQRGQGVAESLDFTDQAAGVFAAVDRVAGCGQGVVAGQSEPRARRGGAHVGVAGQAAGAVVAADHGGLRAAADGVAAEKLSRSGVRFCSADQAADFLSALNKVAGRGCPDVGVGDEDAALLACVDVADSAADASLPGDRAADQTLRDACVAVSVGDQIADQAADVVVEARDTRGRLPTRAEGGSAQYGCATRVCPKADQAADEGIPIYCARRPQVSEVGVVVARDLPEQSAGVVATADSGTGGQLPQVGGAVAVGHQPADQATDIILTIRRDRAAEAHAVPVECGA